MNLISVDSVSRIRSGRTLFNNISFGIDEGEKLALIGINGCGKSTLLRILAGEEEIDGGTISRNRECRIAYLHQHDDFNREDTILEHILNRDSPLMKTVRDYEKAADRLAKEESREIHDHYDKLLAEMDRLGCWELESRINSLLTELGIENRHLKMGTLSGGMLKKVAIVHALVAGGDLLFLDEPTNHLDIDTIIWLQDYLKKSSMAVVLVTHDRYFLDELCTGILEIDNETLYRYEGNYTRYLQSKAQREAVERREQERINTILRREMEWLKRGPRARTGKDRGRKNRVYDMMDRQTSEEIESAEFSVSQRRLGKRVVDLINISKSFDGREVIPSFSYKFRKGERIGIVGPNGSGKSTFLNLLTERLPGDSGSVNKGVNTHFGYFDQLTARMPDEMKVLEYLKDQADLIKTDEGSSYTPAQLLERFLFPKSLHFTALSDLSGGEKRRLYLISIILQNPNFLILDEPTNDFDIQTLSLIEDFLMEYSGCLMVVSHDRYFLDRVTDFLFIFDGTGHIRGFAGNYSEYRQFLDEEKREEKKKVQQEKPSTRVRTEKKKKAGYKEIEEFKQIEKEIESMEEEKSELEDFFASAAPDPDKMAGAHRRYSELERELETKMERWEELAELMDS
ncbi:ABC-F family ATP-binding cassette domain-containing protein [Spirochaeta isovalerica]|uniref:ATP-binding cassette subfamily F protein uup n=1 Tax=Spirochaeta isovalerica TaxID=150 RepID=A0A841RGL7_9SPIO|nr:ABC-F family ATP-binding cassette domain-containing protein [Spirochaeta isovalerica]MBB6481472.1 ATP-binding cassette subfamily F protein uup [Spirochaeta isovalerica]